MRQDAPEIQLSSCSGPQPFQPGTSSRRPRNLQTKTLGCVGQMARSRGLTAAWVWACCAIRRRRAVTLTMPFGGRGRHERPAWISIPGNENLRPETFGGRRQLQSQGLAAFTIATPDRRSRFRLDLPYKFRCDQFGCDFLRCPVLQSWRRRKAAVVALRGSPHHRELTVGKLDGHDLTLRIVKGPANPGPSLTRAPDRKRSPRRRDCKATHAPHVDTHALFRGERQSFLGARFRSVAEVLVLVHVVEVPDVAPSGKSCTYRSGASPRPNAFR